MFRNIAQRVSSFKGHPSSGQPCTTSTRRENFSGLVYLCQLGISLHHGAFRVLPLSLSLSRFIRFLRFLLVLFVCCSLPLSVSPSLCIHTYKDTCTHLFIQEQYHNSDPKSANRMEKLGYRPRTRMDTRNLACTERRKPCIRLAQSRGPHISSSIYLGPRR